MRSIVDKTSGSDSALLPRAREQYPGQTVKTAMDTELQNQWPYPGSRWWKFDFHTHTPASHDFQGNRNGRELTPEEWLLDYMAAEIDCVAITDHNSGAWIDKLTEAYNRMKKDADEGRPPDGFRPIVLFPGVEISVQGEFHLLAIFDPEASSGNIDRLLGRVGYEGEPGGSDAVTRQSSAQVVNSVLDSRAIPIPAHTDRPKGLLELSDGSTGISRIGHNTLKQVLDVPGILAMEVLDRDSPKPEIYRQSNPSWSEVLGSDNHGSAGANRPGSRYTWVKMASPSLEGLRLALLDGNGVSLMRSDEPEEFNPTDAPDTIITKIVVKQARYMGNTESECLKFSPFYNAIVGGRGTGKSTIVQALRLAFRRDSEVTDLDEAVEVRRRFEQFRQVYRNRDDLGALRKGTEICVTLCRDGNPHRLKWRSSSEGNAVEERSREGVWQTSDSQAINPDRFPVRILSQGQIAVMASGNRKAVIDIIDEAAGVTEIRESFEREEADFRALQARIRALGKRLETKPELRRRVGDLANKLKVIRKSQAGDVLKLFQRASRQRREVEITQEQVESMLTRIRRMVDQLELDDWPEDDFDPSRDAHILAWRASVHDAFEALRHQLTRAADQFQSTTANLESDPGKRQWHDQILAAKAKYRRLREQLADLGETDLEAFEHLNREYQQLKADLEELDRIQEKSQKLGRESETKLACLRDLRMRITKKRTQFIANVIEDNEYVRIRVIPFGSDAQVYERELRELLDVPGQRFTRDILENGNGLAAELAEASDKQAAVERVKAKLVQNDPSFGGYFRNFLERKNSRPEFQDRVRCWYPEDDLEIHYNRGKNDWVQISEGSQGQRSAALLAFLLAFGEEPLVLDQPEDDLDNHLIYDLIVRQIRENKLRRQLLIVTHNPNVVVNGDAELIHAMDFRKGQCKVIECGSLQDETVREEVCLVMEGGREAFARRWARLGRKTTHV